MEYITKHFWIKLAIVLGVAACAYAYVAGDANAADLGGDCCADLEDRIAELEATTARKGNRKVSVVIEGEINKALVLQDWDDATVRLTLNGNSVGGTLPTGFKSQDIQDNSAASSILRVRGEAIIAKDWKAGYVLEFGVGGYDGAGTNDIYTHRSFVFVESPVGRVSLGHASQATDDIDKITTANTTVAVRPLSLRPLIGPQAGEALDLYDGNRGDLVRYDSPILGGFMASASWASGNDDGDVWDAALRYAGEFSGFHVAAGVGYRDGLIVDGFGVVNQDFLDINVISAAASIKHLTSGVFITGNYGRIDGDILDVFGLDADAWAVTGGIEQKFIDLGKTTIFAEYGDGALDVGLSPLCAPCTATAGLDVTYWGFGIVQSVDAAALDLYAGVRVYEFDLGISASDGVNSGSLNIGTEATVGTVGARIKF